MTTKFNLAKLLADAPPQKQVRFVTNFMQATGWPPTEAEISEVLESFKQQGVEFSQETQDLLLEEYQRLDPIVKARYANPGLEEGES